MPLTSRAVVSERFEKVEGRRGPVRHGEELADPARRRGADASHLAVQSRLKMTALPPQQRRNVSGEEDETKKKRGRFINLITVFLYIKVCDFVQLLIYCLLIGPL